MKILSLVSDLSAIAVARVGGQAMNFVYFMLAALWLPKADIGLYSSTLAATGLVVALLTLGSDPIIVRRIASQSAAPAVVIGSALLQRISLPIGFAVIGWVILTIFGDLGTGNRELFGVAFLVTAIGTVMSVTKQALIAKQRFWWSTLAENTNVLVKLVAGLCLVRQGYGVMGLFVGLLLGSMADGTITFCSLRRMIGKWPIPRYDQTELLAQVKESVPLLGTLVFDGMLSRADWIIMGLVRTQAETGDYSVAYRIFEISWLPQIILGTVLLPKLSRSINGLVISNLVRDRLEILFRVLIAVAVILPLAIATCWTPVLDSLTGGKYGSSNQLPFLVLAPSVPFAAATAAMWGLAVAQRRVVGIMKITAISAVVNVSLNLILIPPLGGLGAALTMSTTMIVQCLSYVWMSRDTVSPRIVLTTLALSAGGGVSAYWFASLLPASWATRLVLAVAAYMMILAATRSLPLHKWRLLTGQSTN